MGGDFSGQFVRGLRPPNANADTTCLGQVTVHGPNESPRDCSEGTNRSLSAKLLLERLAEAHVGFR